MGGVLRSVKEVSMVEDFRDDNWSLVPGTGNKPDTSGLFRRDVNDNRVTGREM